MPKKFKKFTISTVALLIHRGKYVGLDFLKLTISSYYKKSAVKQNKEMYCVLSHAFYLIVFKYLIKRKKKRIIA